MSLDEIGLDKLKIEDGNRRCHVGSILDLAVGSDYDFDSCCFHYHFLLHKGQNPCFTSSGCFFLRISTMS